MRVTAVLVAGACALAACGAFAQEAERPVLSPVVYAETLARLAANVGAMDESRPSAIAPAIAALPVTWRVAVGDHARDVSTDWLRREMLDWQQHPEAAARNRLVEHLRFVSGAAAAAEMPGASTAGARAALDRILARSEFSGVSGPSWLDRLIERILTWLIRVIGASVTSSTMSIATQVLVYALIGAAVVLAALGMYRAFRRASILEPLHLETGDRPPTTVAYADAEQAASRGDWHTAITLAYWWGIQTLEARGTWRPDRTRTPREYLRQLPAGSEQAPPLGALTRLIERVSYAGGPADASGYDEAVSQLTQLGCLRV